MPGRCLIFSLFSVASMCLLAYRSVYIQHMDLLLSSFVSRLSFLLIAQGVDLR